jgi:hypothetical protein
MSGSLWRITHRQADQEIVGTIGMCGRVRLDNDYSEIKIRLKFAPDAPAPNYEADYNKATDYADAGGDAIG